MRHSSPAPGPCKPVTSQGKNGRTTAAVVALRSWMVFTPSARAPAPRKIQMISFSVTAVTMPLTAKIPMSSLSRPTVMRMSLTALRAMMAMTAAPMP